MSNSLPRTMRRNAAMRGSTSSNSNAKVRGLTVPSLSAWLLPWLRVTVLSLSAVMSLPRVLGLWCRPRGGGDPYSRGGDYGSPLSRGRHRGKQPYTVVWATPGRVVSASLAASLNVLYGGSTTEAE